MSKISLKNILKKTFNKNKKKVKKKVAKKKVNKLKKVASKKKSKTVEGFGEEWKEFSQITYEHYNEYDNYFDILNIDLSEKIIVDYGCGIGRWSKLLIDKYQNIKTLILVDYSNAIFVARKHFLEYDNVIFIKADLDEIKFSKN